MPSAICVVHRVPTYVEGPSSVHLKLDASLLSEHKVLYQSSQYKMYLKDKKVIVDVVLCDIFPGYVRAGDYLSDSGHSEISSRSSLVSTSSLDMGQEERRQRYGGLAGDVHCGGHRLERRATADPDQYSLG